MMCKIFYGEGFECVFLFFSLFIEKIEVVCCGCVCWVKFYYLRGCIGKVVWIVEK